MDIASLLSKCVSVTFSGASESQQSALVEWLQNESIGGETIAQFFSQNINATSTELSGDKSYILFSGSGANGSNFDLAQGVINSSGNQYGIIGQTDAGSFIKSLDPGNLFVQAFESELQTLEISPSSYGAFGTFQDLAWNFASPYYADNAISSGRPILALVDGANPNRGFAQIEAPEFSTYPGGANAIINGQTWSGISTAESSAQQMMSFATTVANEINAGYGTSLTATDIVVRGDMAALYDASTNTLAGYSSDFWGSLSPDGLQNLANYVEGNVPSGQGDTYEARKAVMDDIFGSVASAAPESTLSLSKMLSELGNATGAASLAGFAATSVAHIAITYQEQGAWAAALEAGIDTGEVAAGAAIFTYALPVLVSGSVVAATLFEVSVEAASFGSLVALADQVENLQSQLTASFGNSSTGQASPTVNASWEPDGANTQVSSGQALTAFNQYEVDLSSGDDTLQAYNVAYINGGDGNYFVTSTPATSGNEYDQPTTSITLGNGNDVIVATGQLVINLGSGTNFVELPVGVDDQFFEPNNWINGGSAHTSTLQYVPVGGDDSLGLDIGLTTEADPNQTPGFDKTVLVLTPNTTNEESARVDVVSGFKTIKLSDQKDTITLGRFQGELDAPLTIDGNGVPTGSGDEIDAQQYIPTKSYTADVLATKLATTGVFTQTQVTTVVKQTFNGIVFDGDELNGTNITFNNFQILYGTNNGDYISGQTDFKNIYLGNGNNVIYNLSGGVLPGQENLGQGAHWVTVDLGSGNSEVLGTTAAGSVITADGSTHHDIINISPDIRLVGLTPNDLLGYDGTVLHGGTHNMATESPYYYSYDGSIEYGINTQGDLVITPTWADTFESVESALGLPKVDVSTYVANYQPYTSTGPGTAGITLVAFSAEALNPFTTPHTGSIFSIWGTFNVEWKAWTGQTWNGVDPLVVDLTGQGLNLTPNEPDSGARFDVNNDGFANPSSWLPTSQGFLVTVDAAGNVKFVTSFSQLAQYDADGDGVITDADLSSAADASLPQLRIWVDSNQDHQPQANELLTLDQAGVSSISVNATNEPAATFNGDSQVLSTAGVTLTNGVQSTVSDVLLRVDETNSTWLGDNSVTANAAALPDMKGFGTLPDLSVALSVDENAQIAAGTLLSGQQSALEAEISNDLTSAASLALATPTLANWRALMDPILTAWTEALPNPLPSTNADWWQGVDNPDASSISLYGQNGSSGTPQPNGKISAYNLVQVNADGAQTVLNTLVYEIGSINVTQTNPTTGQTTEVSEAIGYWGFANGAPVTDSAGNQIVYPTLAQALAMPLPAGDSFVASSTFDDYILTQTNADGSQTALDTLEFIATPDTPGSAGYWAFASGRAITDASGNVIAAPSLTQALATPLAADDSFVLNGEATDGANNAQPNYYFVVQDNANGTQTIVDDLEYRVDKVTTSETDPATGANISVTESVGHWVFGSGAPVTNALGTPIPYATLAQALATPLPADDSFSELTSSEINFLERYTGEQIDLGEAASNQSVWMANLNSFVGTLNNDMNMLAVRLMMQGPLSQTIFAGLQYDPQTDQFTPKTDLGVEPVYQAIFQTLQGANSDDVVTTLQQWKTILDAILSNYIEPNGVELTQGYIFSNIVGAYEATPLAASLVDVASALGITRSEIQVGSGTITGTQSDNLFYVGPGQNTYVGDDSYDNYVVGSQFGDSVIDDTDGVLKQQSNILRFASLTSTEVTASRVDDDLILTDTLDGATLRIVNQFTDPEVYLSPAGNMSPSYGVSEIMFADGVDWTKSDMSYQVAQWGTHNQTIAGTTGDDVLVGGPGDTLVGGQGNETYIYESAFGNMTIEPNKATTTSNYDTLIFPDLTQDDLIFSRGSGSALNDLIITVKSTGDQIDVKGQFNYLYTFLGSWWINSIDSFVFSDGSTLGLDDVMQVVLANEEASGGPVYGFALDDTIDPGPGNKNRLLSGGEGDDTYIFNRGYGSVVINQNRSNLNYGGVNQIDFGPGITADDLIFSRPDYNDLTIKIAGTDDQITIENQFAFTEALVWSGWYQRIDYFNFDDGTHINANQVMTELLQQEEASDAPIIYGFPQDDTFTPGLNNHGTVFSGGNGDDTYEFDRGDGAIVISQQQNNLLIGGDNTLAFGPGISLSDLTLTNVWATTNLLITVKGTDDSVLIAGQYDYNSQLYWNPQRISNFTFADGSTYTWRQIETITDSQAPLSGSQLILGSSDDDILQAGSGYDFLSGAEGNDTYEFNEGINQDVVDPLNSSDDTIVFGPGITSSSLQFYRDNNDLLIHQAGTTSTLTIVGDAPNSNYIKDFEFADGTTLTPSQVEALVDTQNSTFIYQGPVWGPIYQSTSGNAVTQITSYSYTSGSGFVVINNVDSLGSTLSFPDISSTQVQVSLEYAGSDTPGQIDPEDGSDTVLTFSGLPDDRLTLANGEWTGLNLAFADGVTWTPQDLVATYLAQASAAGDALIAVPGDWVTPETLTAAPGVQILQGNANGGDNFAWSQGDGPITIMNNDYLNVAANTLYMHGVSPDQVAVKLDPLGSGDLYLYVNSSNAPTITIHDQTSGARAVAYVQFDDGAVWDWTQLIIMSNGGIASVPTVTATPGDDTLVAPNGNQVLDPGTGNMTMTGGNGNDVFIYKSNYGDDTIIDSNGPSWAEVNAIRLTDLTPSDLIFTRSAYDLIITVNATGHTLTVSNFFASQTSGIEYLLFADGSQWNYEQTLAAAWYRAGPGNVTLTAEDGDGTMQAGTGDDTFVVGDLFDTASVNLVYAAADGNLTIDAHTFRTFNNTLDLVDLTASDVTFSRYDNDLFIKVKSTGHVISIGGEFNTTNSDGIQNVLFADGTTWSRGQIETEADTIGFDKGDGPVVLNLGNTGTASGNKLVLQLGADISASDVYLQTDATDDLIVALRDDQNDRITFTGALSSSYGNTSSQIGTIAFGDGTTLALPPTAGAPTIAFTWIGSVSSTALAGSNLGVNIFDLGPGGDTVTTTTLSDTIDFDKGAGQATINFGARGDGGGGLNLQVASDIAPNDVILQADVAGDLTVSLRDDTDDNVTFKGDLSTYYSTVSQLRQITFGDGTVLNLPVWNAETPMTFTYVGRIDETALTGSIWGSNVFDLGPGGDAVTTESNNDVINFDKGDGQATVNFGVISQGAGNVTLQLGSDIAEADVVFSQDLAGDLTLALRGDSDDGMTFENDLTDSNGVVTSQLGSVSFADGAVWTAQQIVAQAAIEVGPGDQTIDVPGDNLTYVVGNGDDTFERTDNPDAAAETFIYSSADGNLTIDYHSTWNALSNTLNFTDLDADDLTFVRDTTDDLLITVNATGKTITLTGEFNSSNQDGVQNFDFADGSVLTESQITAQVWIEIGPGNQTINIPSDNLSYLIGSGDDTFVRTNSADAAAETFVYGAGAGNATIDYHSTWNAIANTLKFTSLDAADVSFARDLANDLLITVNGTGKTITLTGEFNSSNMDGVQNFHFADGTVLSEQQIGAEAWIPIGPGDQTINISADNLTYVVGSGDDTFVRTNSSDAAAETFVYGEGAGYLTIDYQSTWNAVSNTLDLTDLNANDLTFTRDAGDDLLITVNATGRTIVATGEFNSSNKTGVQTIEFADGSVWNWNQIAAASWLRAGSGDDVTITLPSANVTAEAGSGDDTFQRTNDPDPAAETFVYGSADGNLTIDFHSTWNAVSNTLDFTDLQPSELTFAREADGDLLITVQSTGKTITVTGEFNSTDVDGVQTVNFATGASLNRSDIDVAAASGAIIASAAQVSDTLDILNVNSAVTSITLSDSGTPELNLTATAALADTAALQKITNAAYAIKISDTAANVSANADALSDDARVSSITLTDSGTPTLTLTASQALADGAMLGEITNASYVVLISNPGSEPLSDVEIAGTHDVVSIADATLNAQDGASFVVSGADDTILINSGSVSVADNDLTTTVGGNENSISISADDRLNLTGTDDTVTASAAGAYVNIEGAGSTVTMNNGNGDLWGNISATVVGIGNDFYVDTDDNLTMTGTGDTVTAGGTDDTISISSGSVNVYNSGLITTVGGDENSISIGADDRLNLTGTDDTVTASGAGAYVNVEGAGSTVTMNNGNGDLWGNISATVIGTGNGFYVDTGDNLIMTGTGDTVTAGGTDDTISISSGSVNVYNSGLITSVGGGENSISIGADDRLSLTGTDDTVTASGAGDYVNIEGAGSTVTMNNGNGDLWGNISAAVVGSGNGIYVDTGDNLTITGTGDTVTAGGNSNSISISSGGITLIGANTTVDGDNNAIVFSGNNQVTAAGTGETYSFGSGGGQSEIGAPNGTNTGAVNFGTGLSDEDLWFTQSGNNLQIGVMGTSDSLTVDDWFGGTNNAAVQSFSAGGLKLDTQVNQLVSAMATYAANNPSFNPTAVSQAPNDTSLQNAIAAAWHS